MSIQDIRKWLDDYRERTCCSVATAIARRSEELCDLHLDGAETFRLARTTNTEAMVDALLQYNLLPRNTRQDEIVAADPNIREYALNVRTKILAECAVLRHKADNVPLPSELSMDS